MGSCSISHHAEYYQFHIVVYRVSTEGRSSYFRTFSHPMTDYLTWLAWTETFKGHCQDWGIFDMLMLSRVDMKFDMECFFGLLGNSSVSVNSSSLGVWWPLTLLNESVILGLSITRFEALAAYDDHIPKLGFSFSKGTFVFWKFLLY